MLSRGFRRSLSFIRSFADSLFDGLKKRIKIIPAGRRQSFVCFLLAEPKTVPLCSIQDIGCVENSQSKKSKKI